MASFDFQIDESFVGQSIGPADGFLVSLSLIKAGPYETPDHTPAGQHFTSGYLTLKGENDLRPIYNLDVGSNGGALSGGLAVIDGNVPYRGALRVACIPRGSQWSLTLSDTPNVRRPSGAALPFPLDIREREREYARR